ncbi:MAG: ADOP family duplicated permease [Longimicrobiales bacterium]
MSAGRKDPPRLAVWLLECADRRGHLLGDLEEEYRRFHRPRGRLRADAWFWRQALRTLPGLAAGHLRRGGGTMADLRQALRALRRRPGFALMAVATFALALGANALVFSLVHSVLLRPLPFVHAERLVHVHPDALFLVDLEEARAVAEATPSVERALPWGRALFLFTGAGVAEEVRGATVEWYHFDALGAAPAVGRAFTRDDAAAGDAVILSHALWTRRFGGDRSLVGQRVDVSGRPRTVVGVMGPDHVPMEPDWDVWSPLPVDAADAAGRPLALVALLRPGATVEASRAELRTAFRQRWGRSGNGVSEDDLAVVAPVSLRTHLLGDVSTPLRVLQVAAWFVLLLACANVANLLLAQGGVRSAEVAVRASLGASRGRIVRQLLLEVGLLAVAGCVLGLLLAAGLHSWGAARLPDAISRGGPWRLGAVALAYTALTTGVAALLSGALPSWRTAGGGVSASTLRGARTPRSSRLSGLLVAVEVAASVVLVVGAGLMVRSFAALRAVDPGFDAEGVVTVRVSPPPDRYATAEAVDAFYGRLRERALALPGAEAAGAIMFLPMTSGGYWNAFRASDAAIEADDAPSVAIRIVTPGYVETMGIRVLAGRALGDADGADGARVGVINQTLARQAFGDADPVGRTILLGRSDPEELTVVGVVADVRQSDLRQAASPEVLRPLAQEHFTRMYLVVRAAGPSDATLGAVQRLVLEEEPDAVVSRPALMADVLGGTLSDTRLVTQMLSVFGLLALCLGAVGVYGVTAHTVARRTREIGIRMALGAESGRVARRTVASGLVPVVVGMVVGVGAALALSTGVEALLFSVSPRDPLTFLAVPAVLTAVAVAALAVPALRASSVDPVRALRSD